MGLLEFKSEWNEPPPFPNRRLGQLRGPALLLCGTGRTAATPARWEGQSGQLKDQKMQPQVGSLQGGRPCNAPCKRPLLLAVGATLAVAQNGSDGNEEGPLTRSAAAPAPL